MQSPKMFEQLAHTAQNKAGRIHVRSALNPILWLCLFVPPSCWTAAFFFSNDAIVKYGMICLGALPVLVARGAYVGFAIKDRPRLQSEDYQLREHTLQIISQKGGALPLDATSLQAIANPAIPSHALIEAPEDRLQ